jgi:hypothetical protein
MTVYAPPGHFYSPIVNPDDIVGLRLADANFASPDISGVTLDSEAMVRLWRGAKEILNSVPFSEEPTSGHHHYFKNDSTRSEMPSALHDAANLSTAEANRNRFRVLIGRHPRRD